MSEKEHPRPKEEGVLALSEAAHLAYVSAMGHATKSIQTLAQVARMIAARTQVFARTSEQEDYALIWPDEVFEGHMEDGGRLLSFTDGRAPLRNLVIKAEALESVVAEIQKLYNRG